LAGEHTAALFADRVTLILNYATLSEATLEAAAVRLAVVAVAARWGNAGRARVAAWATHA